MYLIIRYWALKSYILTCKSNGDESSMLDYFMDIELDEKTEQIRL